MAYATDIRSAARASGIRARITTFAQHLTERRAQAKVYRSTLRELAELSNRDLSDLGISRANIRSVAYEAAYGA